MRKAIMGVGTFLALLGLIQLILSVALIGPVRAQVGEIDPLIEDAAGMLTDVADSVDRGAAFLAELDPNLADVERTIRRTIDDSVRQLGELDADLVRAEPQVEGAIDGTLRFLGDLDGILAGVEEPLGIIDDTVRFLDGLDASLAVTERALGATLDGSVKTLGELDASLSVTQRALSATLDASVTYLRDLNAALADVDRVAAATIDDTLNYLGDLDATLAALEEMVSGLRDGVIFTRDTTTEMLGLWEVGIWAEDIDPLVAPADTVLADTGEMVAEMTAGVESARDRTKEWLEPIELGIWPDALVGWAEWIEAAVGFEVHYLRDLAAFIDPGWVLFPRETITPAGLEAIATLLEGAGVDAAWFRAEAARLRLAQEVLAVPLTPEGIAGVFTPAIENLELAAAGLADARAWLQRWPALLRHLEKAEVPLRFFPLEMTADDVDTWADEVEAAGFDAGWLREQADFLRREGLMWSLTAQDFYRAFTPVIGGLDLALDSLADVSAYMGTLQTNLEDVKQTAADIISETRELMRTARTSLEGAEGPILDGMAGTRELLKTTRTYLDELEEPVLASISHGRELLRTARTSLEEAKGPVRDGLAGSRAAIQATETSVAAARRPVIDGIAGTRELLGTAKTSLEDIKTPVLDGISDTRGYLRVARVDVGAVGDGLRDTRDGIVGLGIGGMIGDMIGWLQTYMVINGILFMAAGAGLFLVGMKKAES